MSGQAQPIPGQDPRTEPGAAAPVANPAAANARPWDADLSFIQDDAQRQAVSDYLASTWQPRMTQIEQASAQAQSLLSDFRDTPRDTLLEVTEELYGEAVAKALASQLDGEQGNTPDPADEPRVAQPQAQEPSQTERDPEVQALIDRDRQAREKEAFDAEYERVKTAHPDLALDYDLYLQAVADTGDFDQAVVAYQERYGTYDSFLREQAAAEPTPEPAPTAPPVVGAEGTAEVPTEPQNQTIGEAIDTWAQELGARGESVAPTAPAPPVPTG